VKRLHSSLFVFSVVASATVASASSIDHFDGSSGPHNFITTPDAEVLPHLELSLMLVGSYAHDPFVFRDDNGKEVAKIVDGAYAADLAFAVGLFDAFEVGLSLPGANDGNASPKKRPGAPKACATGRSTSR
jgi:hypothetical protein